MAAASGPCISEVQAAVDVTIAKSELRNAADHEGAKATLESCWLASGMLQDASAFLDVGRQIQEDSQQLEEEAVAAAVARRLPGLQEHVTRGVRSLEQVAKRLLANIAEGKLLPADDLEALNVAIGAIEQPYPLIKSDAIPKQLLNAEPGSKLYPHLIKKIEVVCKRSALDIEQRCSDALRGQLLQAGLDPDLDHQRQNIASDYRSSFEKHALKYTSLLSLSDHSPVFASIPTEGTPSAPAWKVFTWNVLEFPKSDDCGCGSRSITDGVNPVCGQLISALNNRKRKRADEHSMLLSGMSLKPVINYHVDAVVDLVRCALADARADVAMLQELNRETVARLREACESSGLHYTFSPARDDESKCDAITAVISNMPLTEHKNVTVQEGNKIRQFAAGKISSTWFVSCHMPMDESQARKKKGGTAVTCDGDVAAKAVNKIIEEVFVKSCAKQLVIGGDWNTDLRLFFDRLSKPEAKLERCGKTVSLHAPPHDVGTCLGVGWPIDGFLRVS